MACPGSGGSRNLKRGVPTLRMTIMQASISIPHIVLNLGKGGSMEPPLDPPLPGDMVKVTCMVQRGSGLQWVVGSVIIEFSPLDINASNQSEPNRKTIVNGVNFNAVLTEVVPVGTLQKLKG